MPAWLLFAFAAAPDPSRAAASAVAEQECRSTGSTEITVCARRDGSNRYQVTDPHAGFDVHGQTMSVMRERSRWIEGGESGPGSCRAVGPGGWTGCMVRQWHRNDLQNPWRVKAHENDGP